MARIVVGMSGGVDSSATAALLLDEGHEVIGITLHLWDYAKEGHAGRCCAPEDQYDARRVCDALGIAHYTFDRRELFREKVVDSFVSDYAEGRTPSPCVRCNENVKLSPLWSLARRLGADAIATGHYARIEHDGEGVRIRVAAERARDQSYFLFAAPVDALRALRLPLGHRFKKDVRAYMEARGLPGAHKQDSTDLCFLEGDDYAGFIEARMPGVNHRSGTIEDVDGRIVGTHDGVHRFTVGQRRGLGGGAGQPRYVLRVLPEEGRVIVGDATQATVPTAIVQDVRWLTSERVHRVHAKLRYKHDGVDAVLEPLGEGRVQLHFDEPQRGVAPGQAAVFYDGERLLGGGWLS